MPENADINENQLKPEDVAITEDTDRLYDIEEMAAHLGIRPGALKDWTKLDENPCPCFRKDARFLRFDKAEVRAWLRERTSEWYAKRKTEKEVEQPTLDPNTKFEIIE